MEPSDLLLAESMELLTTANTYVAINRKYGLDSEPCIIHDSGVLRRLIETREKINTVISRHEPK